MAPFRVFESGRQGSEKVSTVRVKPNFKVRFKVRVGRKLGLGLGLG